MKRLTLIFAAMLCFLGMTAHAQVKYLANEYTPSASYCYKAYKYNGASSPQFVMGGLKWQGGFTIGHTDGPFAPGYATFNIGGRYDKLMFVLGYLISGIDNDTVIFTVLADGQKIFDRVIYVHSTEERVTLDIKGVKELKFQIVTGHGRIGVAEATLWAAGQTPKQTGNLITGKARTIELVKDLKSYYNNDVMKPVSPDSKVKSFKINGVDYSYGLCANMSMALVGNNPGWAYFNLRGQYEKLSFIVGPLDDGNGRHGKGWFTVKADGKILWEYEMNYDDIAKQVTLDVSGCRMLSFHSEQEDLSTSGAFAKITAWPAGEKPQTVTEEAAPVNPRLKTLPDVCKLISNIPPYSSGASVDKQVYDGTSDYITFSMGGVRFSEGIVLYKTANFWDDSVVSYSVFDLGNEFDYVSFTAGYIGKSWAMNNGLLRVYADDELLLETQLQPTFPNQDFVLPIRKCRRLRFENVSEGKLDVAAFGVADLVVYRGEPVENSLFVHPRPYCPDEIDLLDLGAPYIHYVAPMKDHTIYYDGSTQKNYFTVGGRRINKGFLLQTSVHFSFDFGPLAQGSSNAAAAAAGTVAVGSSFVAGATAVGGAVIGSTLAGVAAFLALAAGGEAVENSCAVFNTYGEYNSVTFTVACVRPNNQEHPSDYNETLLIGADRQVVAELAIKETMEPQTITVPINGCEQLIFWIANTYNWSGVYAFYDIKLSKSKSELDIPRASRSSHAVVSSPQWTEYTIQNRFERVRASGAKSLDEFHNKLANVQNDVERILADKPFYKINTYYLETNAGQVCKAVQLRDIRSDGYNSGYHPFRSEYNEAERKLERLYKIKRDIDDLTFMQANAALDIPTLGLGAITYGKVFKSSTKTLKECREIIKQLLAEQKDNTDFLRAVIGSAFDIDGKQSSDRTIYCPLFSGEPVPEGGLQPVEQFYDK